MLKTGGTHASCPMLITTDSGKTRVLRRPCLGCSPRPRKSCGGSSLKAPNLSRTPLMSACVKRAVSASFFFLSASFSSLVRLSLFCLSCSRQTTMSSKLHLLRSLIGVSSGRTAWKTFQKFLTKISFVSYSLPLTDVQYVAISSASGLSFTVFPSYLMGMPWGSYSGAYIKPWCSKVSHFLAPRFPLKAPSSLSHHRFTGS
mmetsp:Transcript_66389/g.205386  ORF Transcript_66389/g.205386 Transcript_66389/m.205386 type:complete len:201 (+) Transcript_66389:1276-1878(+)